MAAWRARVWAIGLITTGASLVAFAGCSPPAPRDGGGTDDAMSAADAAASDADECERTCTPVSNASRRCVGGGCLMTCNDGFADCDLMATNGCEVDVRASSLNCGMCGRSCMGLACTAGMCGCPAGRQACGMSCTDVGTDRMNCGDCGRACPGESICQSGICVCTAPQVPCPTIGCRDLMTDAMHCGMCGRACAAGQTCAMGMCR